MLQRIAVTIVCVLLVAGCQQSGPAATPVGVTGPSSVALKAVDVPFSGRVIGGLAFVANPQSCPSGITIVNDSTGTALHMGAIAYHVEQCTNPLTGAIDGRQLVVTAANGDQLHGTFTGHTTPAGGVGTRMQVTATFTFTGGTGRFKDATGSAEMVGELTHAAAFPWPGSWEWTGTIRY